MESENSSKRSIRGTKEEQERPANDRYVIFHLRGIHMVLHFELGSALFSAAENPEWPSCVKGETGLTFYGTMSRCGSQSCR